MFWRLKDPAQEDTSEKSAFLIAGRGAVGLRQRKIQPRGRGAKCRREKNNIARREELDQIVFPERTKKVVVIIRERGSKWTD